MLDQFLDGNRYISGIWRILDSWGNIHSIMSGQGPLGWFYGYAAYKPADADYTFSLNYLDGISTEEEAGKIITGVIDSMFINPTTLYKADFNIDEPPTLIKMQHYEIRSADPIRIRKMLDLALTISLS